MCLCVCLFVCDCVVDKVCLSGLFYMILKEQGFYEYILYFLTQQVGKVFSFYARANCV